MNDFQDYDDDPPFICPLRREPCVRAFCEDHGCADKLAIPRDEYDFAAGSINWDEIMPRLPSLATLKRRSKSA